MKTRYEESFLFPNSQEDFGRSMVFPQGQLHGLSGLSGQESLQVIGSVFGLHSNGINTVNYKIVTRESALAALQPLYIDYETGQLIDISGLDSDQLEYNLWKSFEHLNPSTGKNYLIKGSSEETKFSLKQAAAEQAAAAAAAAEAAAQQAARELAAKQSTERVIAEQAVADAARQRAAEIVAERNPIPRLLTYEEAKARLKAANSWGDYLTLDQMQISLTSLNNGNPVIVMGPTETAAAVAATTTQTTTTNPATGTVQTIDKVTGTTSTTNAATGSVRLTLSDGTTATGTGAVTAGGVITTVDSVTGVVTTQNTQTGVVTQTDATTGKTVTATQITGGPNTGGTLMLPDGKTVTTTQPITSTTTAGGLDSGKIALLGLLGFLLLREAVR